MKILEDNYKKPKKIRCGYCTSLLEVEKEDIERAWEGSYYIQCPLCCRNTYIEDITIFDF